MAKNRIKLITSALTTAALVSTLVAPALASDKAPFQDIPGSYAEEAITFLNAHGILNGVDEKTFAPNGLMNREQFATMLVLTKEVELQSTGDLQFADNRAGAWYHDFVQTAANEKIMSGEGGGLFGIGKPMKREEAIVAILNMLGMEQLVDPNATPDFKDAADIAPWAKGYVALAQKLGIVVGTGEGFQPKVKTTRAMGAQMLYLSLKEYANHATMIGFDFQGFDKMIAGQESTFTISALAINVPQELSLRYKATLTGENGTPLANQTISYETPLGWQTFTTDENGVAYFGPAEGFKPAEIGLEKSISTQFKTTIANAGNYSLQVSFVQASDLQPFGRAFEQRFTVAPAQN